MQRGLNLYCRWLVICLSVFGLNACSKSTEPPPEEKVEIEFFQHKVEAVDTLDAVIAAFQAEHPNIIVRQNYKPEILKILFARMTSGDAPDLFSNFPQFNDFRLKMEKGHFLDLTSEPFIARIDPYFLDQIKFEGRDFVLPVSLNMVGVFYNQDIFGRLNLSPPATYGEMIALCQALQKAGITPFTFTNKTPWTVEHYASLALVQEFSHSELRRLFAAPVGASGWDAERANLRRAAVKIRELQRYGHADAVGIEYVEGIKRFAKGESAMYIQGIWAIPEIQKASPDLRFAAFVFPADAAKNSKVIYGIDFAIAASAHSAHPEAAKKFLEFVSRVETGQSYADKDKSPSLITGVKVDTRPYEDLVQAVKTGRASVWPQALWPPGTTIKWRNIAHTFVIDSDIDAFVDHALEAFSQR